MTSSTLRPPKSPSLDPSLNIHLYIALLYESTFRSCALIFCPAKKRNMKPIIRVHDQQQSPYIRPGRERGAKNNKCFLIQATFSMMYLLNVYCKDLIKQKKKSVGVGNGVGAHLPEVRIRREPPALARQDGKSVPGRVQHPGTHAYIWLTEVRSFFFAPRSLLRPSLMPPHGSQALATELGAATRPRRPYIKLWWYRHCSDVGLTCKRTYCPIYTIIPCYISFWLCSSVSFPALGLTSLLLLFRSLPSYVLVAALPVALLAIPPKLHLCSPSTWWSSPHGLGSPPSSPNTRPGPSPFIRLSWARFSARRLNPRPSAMMMATRKGELGFEAFFPRAKTQNCPVVRFDYLVASISQFGNNIASQRACLASIQSWS